MKICGITNKEDAQNANSLGADALGFIFHKESPRYISPEKVEEIVMFLPPFTHVVGVFVNSTKEEIEEITERCRLNLIQLHGDESPQFCMEMPRKVIKAFRVSELEDLLPVSKYQGMVSAILLDTKVTGMYGGTGKTFDWGLGIKAKEYEIPVILSGGINGKNIGKAIQLVNPYAVDLSSGVESEPGKKDYEKMKEIVELAKQL